MPSKEVTTASGGADQSEGPTDRASLQIFGATVSAQGTAAAPVAIGVIGPALTIGVGYPIGFPVWAIVTISALQFVLAVIYLVLWTVRRQS